MSFLVWAGSEYEFTGLDDKKYFLKPLDLEDWGRFVSWVQYKPYRDALAAELPKEKCEKIYQECKSGYSIEIIEDEEVKIPLNINSTIVQESLYTADGVNKFILLSLKKTHPEIKSLSEVVHLTMIPKLQEAVLNMTNGIEEDIDLEEEKEEPDPN